MRARRRKGTKEFALLVFYSHSVFECVCVIFVIMVIVDMTVMCTSVASEGSRLNALSFSEVRV